jgi:glucose/arabinose dehydrogenase
MAQNMATRVVRGNLFIPWEIVYGPDGRIWMTQKNGYICRLEPGTGLLDTVYHETATVIRGEGGMTGMALHPSFPTVPYVYAVHNYLNGTDYRIRVMRYTYNGTNSLGSPLILLDGISGSQNHNGSRLLITGNQLYITTGDAENLAAPQSTASINGKVLRINLDGTIPSDNPISSNPIWSRGHRNPQGLVAANGFIYSSEHGPNSDDELNIIGKGRNYGWPKVAGFCNTPAEATFCADSNVAVPLIAWTPTLAVAGIDYYTQPMFPTLQGKIIMATLKDAHLYSLTLNGTKDSVTAADVITAVSFGRLRDVCISPGGRIYISTSNSNASGTGTFTDQIVELYNPAATGIGRTGATEVRAYPDPVGDMLHVTLTNSATGYRIADMTGRSVLAGPAGNLSFDINTSSLVPGVYLLWVHGAAGGQTGMQRFVKGN